MLKLKSRAPSLIIVFFLPDPVTHANRLDFGKNCGSGVPFLGSAEIPVLVELLRDPALDLLFVRAGLIDFGLIQRKNVEIIILEIGSQEAFVLHCSDAVDIPARHNNFRFVELPVTILRRVEFENLALGYISFLRKIRAEN